MMNDPDNPLASLRDAVDDDTMMAADAADRLEARLRVAHAARRPTPSPGRPRRPALAAMVVVLLVIAVTFAVVARDGRPSAAALVLTDAENVTVVLPDGTIVIDPADGFELPDGSIVEIGDGGQVTIDEMVLDTPAVLAVRDGRLVADVAPTTTGSADVAPTTAIAADPSDDGDRSTPPTDPPAARPDEPVPVRPTPTTTPEPERDDTRRTTTTTVTDRGDDPPDPSPRGDDVPGADTVEPTVTRPLTADVDLGLTLELERADGAIRVTWLVTGLEPGWQVAITRATGYTTAIMVVTSTEATGSALDRVPPSDGQPVHYRLVILDEAGGEVAAGPRQSLR